MTSLPLPYRAYTQGSFALFTIEQRFPKILAEIQRAAPAQLARDPRWQSLMDAIASGDRIDPTLITPATSRWKRIATELSGKHWHEVSFLDLEFLFYHALNTIASHAAWDIFAEVRREALRVAMPALAGRLANRAIPDLETAIDFALFGNRVDLSQLARNKAHLTKALLVDEGAALIATIRKASLVHIVADNAGEELCADLVLCAALLERGDRAVTLHLKPWPMFVSDALADDCEQTLNAFAAQQSALGLRNVARLLRDAQETGRFKIRAADDWGEPRSFGDLSPQLTKELCGADVIILKGDLNYRRCFEDRAWAASTSIRDATVVSFGPTFALRVLKSETIAGIPKPKAAALDAAAPGWRTNGQFAMIQRVDRGVEHEGFSDRELPSTGGSA